MLLETNNLFVISPVLNIQNKTKLDFFFKSQAEPTLEVKISNNFLEQNHDSQHPFLKERMDSFSKPLTHQSAMLTSSLQKGIHLDSKLSTINASGFTSDRQQSIRSWST